jgi:peroxiredoxin
LRDDFSEDRLEIISISVDKTKADLENGIKKYALNWTHVFQDQGLITKYQIYNGIPSTFLIDKEGVLVFKQVGRFSDTGELRKLMMKNESRHE